MLARFETGARETHAAERTAVEWTSFRMTHGNRSECPWRGAGPHPRVMSVVPPFAGCKDRNDFLPAMVLHGLGPKSFTCDLSGAAPALTTVDVNTVEVVLAAAGTERERVRATLLDGGGTRISTGAWLTLPRGGAAQTLTLDLPRAADTAAQVAAVRIEFEGQRPHAALVALRVVRTPPALRLPTVGSPRLLRAGGNWRRGAGLVEGSPWRVEGEASRATRLELDVHVPSWAVEAAEGARLVVRRVPDPTRGSGLDQGRELARLPVPEAARDGWVNLIVPLPGSSAQDLGLELEVQDDDGLVDCAVAIGDAVLSRPDPAARTFVLITSDTHRADHLGSAGAVPFVRTPALDRLSSRGLTFTDCQSTTNVTNPSHIAMLSGLHPRDTQIVDNKTRLSETAVTLAEVFRQSGYRTFASISTQHLDPTQSGLGQGFDRFEAPSEFKRSGNVAVDLVTEWLERAEGQSVFAWIHVFDAHAPYGPPDDVRAEATRGVAATASEGLGIDERYVPPWIRNEGIANPAYVDALYRGEVDWIDRALSALLDGPRLEDATIAFTSDHGESFRAHSMYWDHAALYLPMVQVPLLLAGPGVAMGRSQTTVQQIDVGRTLLNLAGIEHSFPGRDLVEVAQKDAPDEPRFALAAHGLQASVSSGPWFLVMDLRTYRTERIEHEWTKGRVQLFDRREGVDTEVNVAAQHPDLTERMRASLLEFLASAATTGLGSDAALDDDARANLEALGYAGFEARTDKVWYAPSESRPSDKD